MTRDKIYILSSNNQLYNGWIELVGLDFEFVPEFGINWSPPEDCALLVTHSHYRAPDVSILKGAFDNHVPTLVISDGILEYRNTWAHPDLSPGSIFQPLMGHKIAALGHFQRRILESWGNLGQCEVVGSPRMDALMEVKPRVREEGDAFRILVMTARTPGFTPAQLDLAKQSLLDLKSWFLTHPKVDDVSIEPIWRITKGLDEEIGVANTLSDLSGKELSEQLQAVDAVITTPSTSMLEAMLVGLPVAVVDYTNSPAYVQAAWNITAECHMEYVVPELLKPPAPKMLFQETILHENLECREPAIPRMVKLVREMIRQGRECRNQNKPLRFSSKILADIEHHLPEESFDLQTLYPGHPVFSDMDRARLQVENGHLKKSVATLEARVSFLEEVSLLAERQRAELSAQMEGLLNSYSWRVTAPLRAFLRFFSRNH